MLDNIDYSDPAVLEAFKEMIGELRPSVVYDIIKRNKVLNDEFLNH